MAKGDCDQWVALLNNPQASGLVGVRGVVTAPVLLVGPLATLLNQYPVTVTVSWTGAAGRLWDDWPGRELSHRHRARGSHTPAGPDRGPDRISLVAPVGNTVGTATDPPWVFNNNTSIGSGLPLTLPSATAVTNMATEAGGSLTAPPAVISIGGAITTTVSSASGANLTVPTSLAPTTMKQNSPIYLLQCITYQIIPSPDAAGLCAGRSPCLVRGVAGGVNAAGVLDCTTVNSRCTSIADEIEDIQFAYGCDGCVAAVNGGIADGIIDNQGGAAGFDQADFVTNTAWGTGLMTADKIQLAQLTIVGRQRRADQGFGGSNQQTAQSTALQVSDHLHSDGVFAAGDYATLTPPYTSTRRRLLTRTIELRNLRH